MALGIFICKPPRSFGKVKSAVDVFGDICQASLLHLTKAAMSLLNSFSGQVITNPEKARSGARVHSISLRQFSIEKFPFLRRKHAISVIPSITYLLWGVLSSHILYRITRSRMGVLLWVTFNAVPLSFCLRVSTHVCSQGRVGLDEVVLENGSLLSFYYRPAMSCCVPLVILVHRCLSSHGLSIPGAPSRLLRPSFCLG